MSEALRAARLKRPLAELKRKADKAAQRGLWTQEDMDHADAAAADLVAHFALGREAGK
jgi:hypothetical protein